MSGHIPTSANTDWCTPPEIIEAVRKTFEGQIDLDPCSNMQSTVGAIQSYRLPETDGLAVPWTGRNVFVNPPYGRSYLNVKTLACVSQKEFAAIKELPGFNPADWKKQNIADWVAKCNAETSSDRSIIALIPAAVDTRHWQKIIFQNALSVCFLRGRPHFYVGGEEGGPAPMACAVVGWGPLCDTQRYRNFQSAFDPLGTVIDL